VNELGGTKPVPWWDRYTDWTRLLPETVKDQSRRIAKLLFLGFALRIVLLPLFGGTDASTTAWISTVLLAKGQLILSNDPPPIFYLHALIFQAFRPIYPAAIFSRFVSPVAFTPMNLLPRSILSEPGIGVLLTILKLPYLAFDLASAVLLLWLVRQPQPAIRTFKIWLFNPVVLYVSYFFSQFDIVAVFFVILAFYYNQHGRRHAALLALSVAILFKDFAIILVPFFLVLYLDQKLGLFARFKEFLKVALASTAPVAAQLLMALTQTPFYESANYALTGDQMNGFFGRTLYNRGAPGVPLIQGFLTFIGYSLRLTSFAPIPDVIYLFPLAYLMLFVAWILLRGKDAGKLWNVTVILFLLLYAFNLFHPQWFLWAQPFLIVLVARQGKPVTYLYTGIVGLFFGYMLYFDAIAYTFPLIPLIPAAAFWPGPTSLMRNAGLPAELIINLARTGFSALCLAVALRLFRNDWLRPGTPDP
jgi:Gpi18-like mannosyltransferase